MTDASVTHLADHRADPPSTGGGIVDAVRRRLAGAYEVDPWGMDTEVHGALAALGGVRWSVSIGGAEHVPADGPALLVANQRLASLSPLAGVLALGRATGRVVRFAGLVDVEPLATALRRAGGVVARPDEVAGVLRDGHVALVWCRGLVRGGARVGPIAHELVGPALALHVPVIPVAIHGNRFGRLLRVEVGPPVRSRRGVGPLAEVELADEARGAVQALLDEASPPSWPWS